MRPIAAISVALILFVSTPASAQEWTEFVSREDGFRVDFPGQPKVQNTTFTSEYSYTLPARVYSVERGRERYLMTVVDYNGIEKMGQERVKGCPPGAEPCHGSQNTGEGYWKMDRGGAIVYATWKFLQRDVKLTHLMWNFMDLVEAREATAHSRGVNGWQDGDSSRGRTGRRGRGRGAETRNASS